MRLSLPVLRSALGLMVISLAAPLAADAKDPAPVLDLPVVEIRRTFPPYASFCARHPHACDLSGVQTIDFSSGILELLALVNAQVNKDIDCSLSDKELYSREEYWDFPTRGFGDCEDIALFKRERLVELGLPRGAITIALVHHRLDMSPHAVLLVETTAGTYLLNMFTDDVVLWHKAPYNFEARERPDGTWERFDQSQWSYD